jgi:anthranilate synthase component 1
MRIDETYTDSESFETEYDKCIVEIKRLINLIKNGTPIQAQPSKITSDFRTLFNKEQFCGMVNKIKEHIYDGDVFQVVLSNRIDADFEGSLLDTYRVLRTSNPSPYMFYFGSSTLEFAGASPETLVKLKDGKLYTFPLAGTKPRGQTYEEDLKYEQDLLSDPKELAEHNMLVDLGRNDLGRISKFGSVNVEKYLSIERFSHVMHIGSTVSGDIRGNKDALDAISAILPAGTLSGATKIRAMQIINELENSKRGIYGGAIGYINFTGNMDTCIAIRFAFKKNGRVFVRSGAGIVADSVPELEFEESINKTRAVINALKEAEGGIDNHEKIEENFTD